MCCVWCVCVHFTPLNKANEAKSHLHYDTIAQIGKNVVNDSVLYN